MSASRSIRAIPMVRDYFGNDGYAIIRQEFTPGKGWVRQSYNKRVSRTWLRKLQAQGVTSVALEAEVGWPTSASRSCSSAIGALS